MGWASRYIARLQAGETVSFRPRGPSMAGRIESGQLVTVQPLFDGAKDALQVGDIVLCKVAGVEYLHVIKGVRRSGSAAREFQIGNNRGGINGWTPAAKVFGKCVKVEP